MKRIRFKPVIISLLVLLAILLILLFGLRKAWGIHSESEYYRQSLYFPELIFENAPEGTAYIDPLIKLDISDENYTEFSAPPQRIVPYKEGDRVSKFLDVNENSEISRLNADGYVSLSLHYATSFGVQLDENGSAHLEFWAWFNHDTFESIFEDCGGFRAAYVDSGGRVLGITEPAVRVYDDTKPTALLANGSKLTFRVWGIAKWQRNVLYIIILAVPCVFAALVTVVIIALVRRSWADGELDNTENLGYNDITDP